jgi:UbiD family decarboxylase
MRPVFEVTAITHRDNPILRGTVYGRPVAESHIAASRINSANGLAAF